MATAFKLAASPTTVNTGGTATINVTCTLDPGGPVTVTLTKGGTQQASVIVTLPAESFPAIKLAGDSTITPADFVLATDHGSLTKQSDGVYTLQL